MVEKQKIFDEKEASSLVTSCQGSNAVVDQVIATDKTVRPPNRIRHIVPA